MAIATDSTTLYRLAQCYLCAGNISETQMLKLGLLAQIANQVNPMADTSPNGLMALTTCYLCSSGASLADLYELGLLQIIANGIGSVSGAPDYISYPGPPVLAPPALQNIVVDSNGQQWMYYQGGWN